MVDQSLSVTVDQEQLTALLQTFDGIMPDIGADPYATEIRTVVLADVDQRFASAPRSGGGAVYGGINWPGLSESYLLANPRREGGQLLRDTGELLNSFTSAGAVFDRGRGELAVGTSLPKARGLAFGVFWGRDIPERARPMIFIWQGLADEVVEVISLLMEDLAE